jgi:hypothetical protein
VRTLLGRTEEFCREHDFEDPKLYHVFICTVVHRCVDMMETPIGEDEL